jgi:hypothetical protein
VGAEYSAVVREIRADQAPRSFRRPQATEARPDAVLGSVERVRVRLLYFDDCPNWTDAARHLETLVGEDPSLEVSTAIIDTHELAVSEGFRGSPTILIDGEDPFASPDDPAGLSCRIYQTPGGPAGAPTLEQLRAAIAERSI